jgi:hypothetical protein
MLQNSSLSFGRKNLKIRLRKGGKCDRNRQTEERSSKVEIKVHRVK